MSAQEKAKTSHKDTFYVTTPIYYVNAKPHLGSLYSTLLADVAARWHQLCGQQTFFLTGTDEHGQKVAEAAQQAGQSPQEFVDKVHATFKHLWPEYHIEYNQFIRTTDHYHVKAVQQWIEQLKKQGDIYKATYEGWYDTSSEAFLTEKDLEFKEAGQPPVSLLSGKQARWVSEECYFFKLSAYQDRLLEWYKNNPHWVTPHERLHEVIAFVEGGLRDLSISRKTITWGIPFPGDDQHVTYVWADALNNYITAIGYGDPAKYAEFSKWWPADLHIMGKDIIRFHAIYWPAFLMASGLELPRKMLVHGWIKVDGQKMSKSLGNVIDPQEIAQTYGVEPIRYYLTRYMAITQDSVFSLVDLEQKLSSDLANDLGNLLNRLTTLALKYGVQVSTPPQKWAEPEEQLRKAAQAMLAEFEEAMAEYYFHRAYAAVWKFINAINAYFHAQAPWKVAATDPERFKSIIAATCQSLRQAALMIWPVMPRTMEQLLASLDCTLNTLPYDYRAEIARGDWMAICGLKTVPPLFKKYEPSQESSMKEQTPEQKPAEAQVNQDSITIDDVVKVKVLVGHITEVADLPGADKIYKMQVDFGEHGMRQICAGIKKSYAPEALLGKKSIFVFNLKPRMLMGVESQGMMLLSKDAQGTLTLVTIDDSVPAGSRLQ